MIEQKKICNALGKLIGWLETWRNENGAYNGFVVHRTEGKRMDSVHDTAWTQSAMIRGYGNLYRKSHENRWYTAMIQAADLFASRYDPETGRIRHTGHEDERFQSLVSCALGICALLSVSDLVDGIRREKYLRLAADHVHRYWINVLWVEKEGAFKFTEIDYYSPNENRFVVNFNTMAVEALLGLYQKTGDIEFQAKALKVGEWLVERWAYAQKINFQLLSGHVTIADDPNADWMAPGGFSYQFTETNREPNNYISIYTGLSLRGFYALYDETKDERFAEIIKAQSQYLLNMRDNKTRLFYHTSKNGKIEKNPQFIAGAGMTLVGLHEVSDLVGERAVPEDTINQILDFAYVNGAYPGFVGKNDTGLLRRKAGGVVWEDVAASTNWNAQLFEYLTRLVEVPEKIECQRSTSSVIIINKLFIYTDTPASVAIASWWPPRSWGLYYYLKKRPFAVLSFYPVALFAKLRNSIKERKQGNS